MSIATERQFVVDIFFLTTTVIYGIFQKKKVTFSANAMNDHPWKSRGVRAEKHGEHMHVIFALNAGRLIKGQLTKRLHEHWLLPKGNLKLVFKFP